MQNKYLAQTRIQDDLVVLKFVGFISIGPRPPISAQKYDAPFPRVGILLAVIYLSHWSATLCPTTLQIRVFLLVPTPI